LKQERKEAMKKMKHGSQGPIQHHDMVMLHGSTGTHKKDPHADPLFHKNNKMHGMPMGMTTGCSSDEGPATDGGYASQGPGAPAMEDNAEMT